MYMTERQIYIITFLVNARDWVTSDQLSVHLNLNRKLIQNEIKDLMDLFGQDIKIDVNKHKGYRLSHISEQARMGIYQAANEYGGKNSLLVKRSTIVLYLLFLKDYITMQDLADTFYMSKTSVSLEMEAIKRWMERYEGIALEVNKKRGIIVHGNERIKRVYCTKHGTVNAFESTPFPEEIKKDYKEYLSLMRDILADLCIEYHFILTGEEFKKNSRFMAETVLRSRMGYIREPNVRQPELSEIVLKIAETVRKKIGYNFTEAELYDVQMMLMESNILTENATGESIEVNDDLKKFKQQVISILNLDGIELSFDSVQLETYIKKMQRREENGNVAINHYNEDIVLRYPLEVSLCYRLVPQYFSKKVTKETSNIALFLASELQSYRNQASVLLVCNQCESIICQIRSIIKRQAVFEVSRFDSMPVYQFEHQTDVQTHYDMLLTTEQETLLKFSGFFLISPVLTNEDTRFLYHYMNRRFKEMVSVRKDKIRDRYLTEIHLKKNQQAEWTLETVIGQKQDGTLSYHTFDQDKIYIGRISPNSESGIRVYHLEEPVYFLQKRIRTIVYTAFHEGDKGILLFFDVVSDILNQLI